MSNIKAIDVDNNDKWDSIVKSFSKYDICYLNGYAKAFQINGDGQPLLLYYDDGSTRAINLVMKRDIAAVTPFKNKIPIGTMFDISTPYGYGGFLVEGKNYIGVNKAYECYCTEQGFICEFVRFHLLSEYRPYYNGICETFTHNVVCNLEKGFDEIVGEFEYSARKNIKRAVVLGLNVEIDPFGEKLNEFLNIYYNTMVRTNAKKEYFFTKDFFNAVNRMKGNYVYFHALSEGEVVSTELVLYGSENCYSFLGGSSQESFSLRPNDFLKYSIIKWAKENGLKRFILGGGYGEDDGIFKYKKKFAPNGVHDFYIGKKIFNTDKYNKLVSIRKAEQDPDFNIRYFPIYRG